MISCLLESRRIQIPDPSESDSGALACAPHQVNNRSDAFILRYFELLAGWNFIRRRLPDILYLKFCLCFLNTWLSFVSVPFPRLPTL